MQKTEALLEKFGPLAIFLGRFIPFLRTFVPFFAGIGGMHWSHFVVWNVLGGLTWSTLFTLLGYFFGGVPFVQQHFEWVIILIILISVIPVIVGSIKAALARKKSKAAGVPEQVATVDAPEDADIMASVANFSMADLNRDPDEDETPREPLEAEPADEPEPEEENEPASSEEPATAENADRREKKPADPEEAEEPDPEDEPRKLGRHFAS